MGTKNEIEKTDSVSPSQMIQLAIEGKADLEKLEKLLELQERHEANEARKDFASDFAIVQANIGAVIKTKVNPQTHSKYAGLDNVLEMSKPVYTEHGFSMIFYEGKAEATENVRVCADVLHKAGHKETYHFDVPLDGVGIKGNVNMTKIHGKASSVSYGRRYLLCMIWNIPTQDDDGNGAGDKPAEIKEPTKNEQAVIDAICDKLKAPDGMVVDKAKVIAIGLANTGRYPGDPKRVDGIAEWYLDHHKREIFKPAADDFAGHYQLDQQEQPPETRPNQKMRKCTKVEDERMKALVQLQLEKAIRLEVIDSMREMTAGEKTALSQLVWDTYGMWPDSDDMVLAWNADINPKHSLEVKK